MAAHVEQEPGNSSDTSGRSPDPDQAGRADRADRSDQTDPSDRRNQSDQPDQSVGELVRQATTHLSALIRGEIELAKLELTASIRRLGLGAVFFGAAAVVVCFSLLFPFVALAEGLVAVGLPRWGAYLVVWGVLLLLAGLLGYSGIRMVKRIRKPERTMDTVRDSARLVRHPGREAGRSTTTAGTDPGTGTGL